MNITEMIDKVASTLEAKGFIREAAELDSISNALDKVAVDWEGNPLEVTIKKGVTIKAGSLRLQSQLKRDLEEAIDGISHQATRAYTDKQFDRPTEKTNEFVETLVGEFKKLGMRYSMNGWYVVHLRDWAVDGGKYDLSKIYDIGVDALDNSQGFKQHNKDGIKAIELLDLIAETYDKV